MMMSSPEMLESLVSGVTVSKGGWTIPGVPLPLMTTLAGVGVWSVSQAWSITVFQSFGEYVLLSHRTLNVTVDVAGLKDIDSGKL
ncbi:hypothetical protein Mfla_1462 [Methylobacillus flagellatus KT]|uniref:Uncharacterized protein n=1 Tax=Methylobacillus flagellatus (strain ATCC 51484 / DSM 6875 / VKM B-1610 / KT) TaxID=265072 RepID=Q1H1A7_METFK|nr:hypothetical protein Mfla_1462 [Methylobacillus flagellatus KT]